MAEIIIAAALALLVAGVFGWLAWGRPLGEARRARDAARAEAEALRDADVLARLKLVDVEGQLRDARERLESAASQVADLQPKADALTAIRAAQAERDAAHQRQIDETKAAFETLATKVLEGAQAQFLQRAEARFAEHKTLSEANIQALLAPVAETLVRYEGELKKVEAARTEAYGGLQATVELVRSGQESVRVEAAKLVNALRASPKARGRWGEQQLRNVLEMAGLAEHADFRTEVSVEGDDGRLRPDVIVRLPGGRQLIIDAKCSMNSFLDACDATDETARSAHLAGHARALRTHADALGRKAYWDQFAGAADYVLMFIPGEQFLSGALEADAGLWEYAFERKVLLATPTNLVAIARTVAVVWRQEAMQEYAKVIAEMAREMYKRLAAMGGHVDKLGNNLNTAIGAFNSFVGSLEGNVMPQARKFAELSVDTGAKALPQLEPIDTAVRVARRDRDLSFDPAE